MAANSGAPVDRVIEVEFGVNLPTSVEVLRTGGTIATYSSNLDKERKLPFLKMMYKDITLRFVIVYAMPKLATETPVRAIAAARGEDTWQHRSAATRPLASCTRVH